MPPLTVQLLVAVTCFTAVYIRVEAADTCPTTTTSCIPGLPGRDGKDGQPGRDGAPGRDDRDGLPGPTGSLTVAQQQEMKESILSMLREEISQLNCCNTSQTTPAPEPSCSITSQDNPATSCQEIYRCDPTAPSGYYWVRTDRVHGPQQVYCEMNTTRCGNVTGGWTRVAQINMTDPEQSCPSVLRTIESPLRMCAGLTSAGCASVLYPTLGLNFTHVCGQALGYQYYFTDGLDAVATTKTIDNPYVDGLSITYGTPRNHLWSYANGHNGRCRCHPGSGAAPPPSFVGQNFYCDGLPVQPQQIWHTEYRLWDGEGCPSGNTCCDPPNLPWFHRALDTPVTGDIEVRWCRDEPSNIEDFAVELMELYVY